MCVPVILHLRVTAQAFIDAKKYGRSASFFFFLFDAWRLRLRRLCSVRHLRPLYFAQRNAQHSAGNDSQLIPCCRRGHSTRERYKWEKHDLKRSKGRETGVVRWRSNTCKRAGALRTSATAENVAGVWPIRTRGLKSKSVVRISENVCNVGSTGSELINFMRFVSVFVWTREVASAKQKMLNPTPWAKDLFTLQMRIDTQNEKLAQLHGMFREIQEFPLCPNSGSACSETNTWKDANMERFMETRKTSQAQLVGQIEERAKETGDKQQRNKHEQQKVCEKQPVPVLKRESHMSRIACFASDTAG